MAKSFVSPGVFTSETDASFLGVGVGSIGAALIGTAEKGPAFVPVTVTSNSEYEEFFGTLNTKHTLGYAARSYLRNSGKANVVRVLGPSGRSVNGTAVTPGYTSEGMWGVVGVSGTLGASSVLAALLEITGSGHLVVNDLAGDLFDIRISGSVGDTSWAHVATTASLLSDSSNYIGKVLNSDPTKFAEDGYYLREVYDHSVKLLANGNAIFSSASYAITDFTVGFNSGSSPWIKSQLFGGTKEYNLLRLHTLGHGDAENGRFKWSIKNVRVSAAPTVSDFGKFDLELRLFDDKEGTSVALVESFSNLSLDPTDTNYVCRVIGDKVLRWDESREKMVESGDFENRSKLIRVEMTTGSFPDAALPWGFRGLAKPDLGFVTVGLTGSGGVTVDAFTAASLVQDLPYVADLLDKKTQSEANKKFYWGMETVLSGSVKDRMSYLPKVTGSDADFSLANVSGSALSNLVYNASNPSDDLKGPGSSTSDTTLEPDLAKFTGPIAFGFDGFDRRLSDPLANSSQLASVSQLGTQALRQAVDVVSDPDFIDINLLGIPGINSDKVVDYAMEAMRDRADVFYVADVTGSTPTEVIQDVNNRGIDNNYAAFYYPPIKVFDDVNSQAKEVPASVAALGAIAFNDRVSSPWFSPAGLNRAALSREVIGFDLLSITDQLKQKERDSLYEARINPIAKFPGTSGVIWGQKTLQLKASALDRINVRRLLIHAKKLVATSVRFLVFEQANATTMTRFRQMVNPILAEIQQKQGLETFKVVMDETTNPPESIDQNRLIGKIFLVPTRAAEFISIDFVISPSGASFSE